MTVFDVAIIGAGIAGLTCAQKLHQAGYQVVVLEKSRGVGGRMATRRLHGTFADHGTCFLKPKGELFHEFLNYLENQGLIVPWPDSAYQFRADGSLQPQESPSPRYIAPLGMTAIAKFLANGLDIRLHQRVIALAAEHDAWQLTTAIPESAAATQPVQARVLILAIPAPQAAPLLETLPTGTVATDPLVNLQSVSMAPCLSVMAGYSPTFQAELPAWTAVSLPDNPELAWIGLDSSKRLQAQQPVFVLQSNATFAEHYLEALELNPAAERLLQQAARLLPWLTQPEWFQVHRWRYAFPRQPLATDYLNLGAILPLFSCGDWCGGDRVEAALRSGLAAANAMEQLWGKATSPTANTRFWETI